MCFNHKFLEKIIQNINLPQVENRIGVGYLTKRRVETIKSPPQFWAKEIEEYGILIRTFISSFSYFLM